MVLTHLHTDHAGGLHHFPNSEILIDPREYALASGLRGKLRGYLPNQLPALAAADGSSTSRRYPSAPSSAASR